MNRLSFIIESLKGKPISTDELIEYFDHRIAAYEAFKTFNISKVYYEPNNCNYGIKIKAQTSNPSDLDGVVSYVNNILHNREDLYCKRFSIGANNIGSLVEINIKEEK